MTTARWFGDAVNRRKDAGLRLGLESGAAAALEASDSRVPVDEGELLASGSSGVTTHNGHPSAYFGYSAGHAVPVHEDMTARHDDGQAKFLEATVAEQPSESSPAIRAVAGALRRALS